jgi:hypothetical protein
MNSIERRIEKLEQTASVGEIRSFESFMAECCNLMDALKSGVRLDALKFKRFHPAMKAGLAKAIPDMERAMCEALEKQDSLPLEVTAQAILIYTDPATRELLTPTLLGLVEKILELERAGQLAVG